MQRLAELAQPLQPVGPDDPGAAIYERFQADPDCMALAVVDDVGRPVGIVERNAFVLQMAAEYGRALYARRAISCIMNRQALVADADMLVAEFCGDVLADRPSELLQGFIVTREGRYIGVGSVLSLLKATSAANRANAEEMTRVAESLNRAKLEAQAALAARSRFLAVMSHEIRTPLNGVLAIAELLASKIAQEELRPYIHTIINSGETLLRLLTDALDLSRADASSLQLVNQSFAVESLFADVAALWESRAAQKGIGLTFTYGGAAGQQALGDAVRVKQVLNNLIGNAIKFTDEGGVDARMTVALEDGGVRLRAEVRDTGFGIPAQNLASIFEPFGQTEEGVARGGAGLGLSVCREITKLMGGAVEARPNSPHGTIFAFDVLLQAAVADDRPAPESTGPDVQPGASSSARVLIVDDNATNRLVAGALCKHLGCDSEAVENGALAVEAIQSGRFDLVLMDIQMPVMDGQTATRLIRALPAPFCEVPILAVTANADPEAAARYLAEGMDGVLEKPIKVSVLAAAMAGALAVERRRAA